MNEESNNVRDDFADSLASIDDKLHAKPDDVDMLSDIQSGIGELLRTNGNSKAQIRKMVKERYQAGALRKETYQLVSSMLDHYLSETTPTSPTKKTIHAIKAHLAVMTPSEPEPADDSFRSTTIIREVIVMIEGDDLQQ